MTTIGKAILALVLASGVAGRCAAQVPAATQGSQGAFVEVEGSKLFYEECGTGPEAVVLIHDGIAHSAVWDDVWPTFCK
jgi:3-oxoadipate enol-lactonase